MTVPVIRTADRRIPQDLCEQDDVPAGLDEPHREGVPQIAESTILYQGPLTRRLESRVDVLIGFADLLQPKGT
jgi:hypothetical protein